MEVFNFAVWKSKNVEQKFKEARASEVLVTRAFVYPNDYRIVYDIQNETAEVKRVTIDGLETVRSTTFDGLESVLKELGLTYENNC